MTTTMETHGDDLAEQVKDALSDPRGVCGQLGLMEGARPQARGLSVRCPLHVEKNPSCSVTVEDGRLRVRCFAGCDFGGANGGGDVLNLVAAVNSLDIRRDFRRVLEIAAGMAGLDFGGARPPGAPRPVLRTVPPPSQPAPPEDLTAIWQALPTLDGDAWEYLRERGLGDAAGFCRALADPSTPRPTVTGHDDAERTCGGPARCAACRWEMARNGYALAVPLMDAAGRVVAVQARSLRPKSEAGPDDRYRGVGPTSSGVFGQPLAVRAARNVIVAEGLTDTLAALLAVRAGRVTAAVGIAGVQATAGLLKLPLAGKRVLIATDADRAGDECAASLGAQLRRLGAIPIRARPSPEGADLASMAAAGVDLPAFFRRVISEDAGFSTAVRRLDGERQERVDIAPRILTLGVRFLDVALGGIFPSDVILLGGATGQGKTELARLIAQANVDRGKRVHYFALEADGREIERRAKYSLLASRVLAAPGGGRFYERLNFLDWMAGRLDDVTGPFEDAVDAELADKYRNLYTYYPDGEFTIDDFERAFAAIVDDTDLVILDHFHFLDFGEQENASAKRAIKTIRRLARESGIPILVVAHIRKADRGAKRTRLVPVLDDFHGSSDVVKAATKAVLLAPATDRTNSAPHLWKTYLSAGKCRVEGSRARYAACVTYDARRRAYDDEFILGTVTPGGDKFVEVESGRWPAWARWSLTPESEPPQTFSPEPRTGEHDDEEDPE